MILDKRDYLVKEMKYIIRSANEKDAEQLSEVRLQIDGETENLDREKGEAFIDATGFERLVKADAEHPRNLFLVAERDGQIIGFSRCEGSDLKRSLHKVEFGVGVLKDYWGYGIGKSLLRESILWADSNGIKKMLLFVLEENNKAVKLYKELGFEIEGVLKNDKLLSDGNFHHTIVMGRFRE